VFTRLYWCFWLGFFCGLRAVVKCRVLFVFGCRLISDRGVGVPCTWRKEWGGAESLQSHGGAFGFDIWYRKGSGELSFLLQDWCMQTWWSMFSHAQQTHYQSHFVVLQHVSEAWHGHFRNWSSCTKHGPTQIAGAFWGYLCFPSQILLLLDHSYAQLRSIRRSITFSFFPFLWQLGWWDFCGFILLTVCSSLCLARL
jgi:hypothetical protein